MALTVNALAVAKTSVRLCGEGECPDTLIIPSPLPSRLFPVECGDSVQTRLWPLLAEDLVISAGLSSIFICALERSEGWDAAIYSHKLYLNVYLSHMAQAASGMMP